ncbi:Uncharacterised protein [Bifidobacterium dentium]|nr:hypothetical protein SAMN05192536_1807 [Bifidobacterium dentium JCM 1195 = DSM 20436]VEG24317.1 Uncharacterised protein [Bifidobacterium dentium]
MALVGWERVRLTEGRGPSSACSGMRHGIRRGRPKRPIPESGKESLPTGSWHEARTRVPTLINIQTIANARADTRAGRKTCEQTVRTTTVSATA